MTIIEEKCLISIVLPVFNGEQYLSESIKSCLFQTYENWELIIVNDASTDNSLAIANKYAAKDNRIRIITNIKNKKLPASLNIGHKEAKGELITWTSDDNCYKPDALQIMSEEIINLNVDLVFSNFEIIDVKGIIIGKYEYQNRRSILFDNIIGACFLYKKEVYERNIGYDEELFKIEDFAFWQIVSLNSTFHHIPAKLYKYRRHNASLTSKKTISQFNYKEEYKRTVQEMYSKFFKSLELNNHQYLSQIFSDLHLHQEIDIYNFLKNYNSFKIDIHKVLKVYGEKKILRELELRIRYNLQRYDSNKNFKTLYQIAKTKPSLLLSYNKKKTLQIIIKSFN